MLSDAVVVYKAEDGKVRARETKDMQPSGAAVSGAMWTGLLGLLIAGPIGWIAGLGIGAGAGAITAKVVDVGIPDEWVDWFKSAVRPHTSTVVALASEVDLTALYHEAQRFAGAELVHTTLRPARPADLAAALRTCLATTSSGRSIDHRQVTQAVAQLSSTAFERGSSLGYCLIRRERIDDLVEQRLDLVAELTVRQDVGKVLADASYDGATHLDRIHCPFHRVEQGIVDRLRWPLAWHRDPGDRARREFGCWSARGTTPTRRCPPARAEP